MKKILMSSFGISIGVGVFIAALATGALAKTAQQGAGTQPAAAQAQPPVGQSPAGVTPSIETVGKSLGYRSLKFARRTGLLVAA